jgi:hypothetical protein
MWITTIVSAVIGGLWFLLGTALSNGAPQSAAIAAQALVLAVLPYVIARAVAERAAEQRRKHAAD